MLLQEDMHEVAGLNAQILKAYLAHFQLTAAEQALFSLAAAMWGRTEIEGLMLCWKCEIKLHLIEKLHVSGQDIGHQPIGSSGSK